MGEARGCEPSMGPAGAATAMKFLLTNDDGIDAPGLAALADALQGRGHRIIVAPHQHLSGCSHQATTHRPLELVTLAEDRHMLDGTPVDCTRVALSHLAPDVDWVISGINAGGNLGADVYHSGTVAAVREAALLGKPGIAVSQYVRSRWPIDWPAATRSALAALNELLARPHESGAFWNVNLPELDESAAGVKLVDCRLDPNPLPVEFHHEDGRLHYRGKYQDRVRSHGCDVDVCFSGHVALTRLRLG